MLHTGDIIEFEGREWRVLRVTECEAVIVPTAKKVREFVNTRTGRTVRFEATLPLLRISPNSELPVKRRTL